MTPLPLTFWQARILLLMTLEPQSVEEVTNRIAERGAVLDPARVRQLLDELKDLGLLEYTLKMGRTGSRYWLGTDPGVEQALDDAYAVVKGGPPRGR